jgi:AraC-like DNA-binding protein
MPQVSFDPKRLPFTPYGLACTEWKPSPMRRPDHHNELELNLMLEGWVTYFLGGRRLTFRAGELGGFWAAVPHQILSFAPGTRYFVVTIPLALLLQWQLPGHFAQRLLGGEVVVEALGAGLARDALTFGQWERDLHRPAEELRQLVLLELEARLRRMLLALPASTGSTGRARGVLRGKESSKVERMACLVAQRYTERLRVAEIGSAVGLHPNYAMNLFKRAFGTTLVEYLTHHRISHAQRLLATTDDKIVEIAFSSGFMSVSRFNEAFRRACGCTPSQYRRRHRAGEGFGRSDA